MKTVKFLILTIMLLLLSGCYAHNYRYHDGYYYGGYYSSGHYTRTHIHATPARHAPAPHYGGGSRAHRSGFGGHSMRSGRR